MAYQMPVKLTYISRLLQLTLVLDVVEDEDDMVDEDVVAEPEDDDEVVDEECRGTEVDLAWFTSTGPIPAVGQCHQ